MAETSGTIQVEGTVEPQDVPKYEVAPDERDMSVKTEQGEGLHSTSVSLGLIYSDTATDGEGKGPEEFAKADAEAHPNQPKAKTPAQSTKKAKAKNK